MDTGEAVATASEFLSRCQSGRQRSARIAEPEVSTAFGLLTPQGRLNKIHSAPREWRNSVGCSKKETVNMNLQPGRIFVVAAVLAVALIQAGFGQSRNASAVDNLKMAIELKKKGDLAAAEAHYREAIRLDPNYAEAHYSYAILLADRDDVNAAMSEYRKAIAIQKDYAEAHFNLALLLRRKGDKTGEVKEIGIAHV